MYTYKAKVERVVDGDTIDVTIFVGFNITIKERLRLFGINAPETRGKEKAKGKKATAYLHRLLSGRQITITTHKKGKFGRYLAVIYLEDNEEGKTINVNDLLVKSGHAVYKDY